VLTQRWLRGDSSLLLNEAGPLPPPSSMLLRGSVLSCLLFRRRNRHLLMLLLMLPVVLRPPGPASESEAGQLQQHTPQQSKHTFKGFDSADRIEGHSLRCVHLSVTEQHFLFLELRAWWVGECFQTVKSMTSLTSFPPHLLFEVVELLQLDVLSSSSSCVVR